MTEETLSRAGSPFELELQLRWSDMDALGHVNNARIITLMEETRIRWTRPRGSSGRFEFGLVVASLTVDYLRQIAYEPTLKMQVGVVRIGTKSFTMRCIGLVDGEPVFDGSTVVVPMAADGKSSRALSEDERAWLEGQRIAARV